MSQPGFNQPPQQPAYPSDQPGYAYVQQNNSAAYMQGTKYKEKALIFGIIGFFFFGIVFGPLAIINANKAEAMNHSATIGKVLGWVDVIAGAIWLVVSVLFIMAAIGASSSGY